VLAALLTAFAAPGVALAPFRLGGIGSNRLPI